MKDKELFQKAIGMDPWVVVSYEFDSDKGRLDLELDFPPGHTFVCPECNTEGCKVYDTEKKSWRHLNFFQYEAYLHARVPRIDCRKCGIKLVRVPWARPGSGFTLLFEAMFRLAIILPGREERRIAGWLSSFMNKELPLNLDESSLALSRSDTYDHKSLSSFFCINRGTIL